jgi:hypothetical protein
MEDSMDNKHLSNYFGDGYWQVSKRMVDVFGIEMSLFITNLYDFRMKLEEDGLLGEDDFFYLLQSNIQERTGISSNKQRKFLVELESLNLIKILRKGLPARNYYKINLPSLVKYIENKITPELTQNQQELNSLPYKEYLQTDHWKSLKKKALVLAGNSCALCQTKDKQLHVHHKTYKNRGKETQKDLIVLCKDCHAKFHNIQ